MTIPKSGKPRPRGAIFVQAGARKRFLRWKSATDRRTGCILTQTEALLRLMDLVEGEPSQKVRKAKGERRR